MNPTYNERELIANAEKKKIGYKEQTKIKCCLTCKHIEDVGVDELVLVCRNKNNGFEYIDALGICKLYERDSVSCILI